MLKVLLLGRHRTDARVVNPATRTTGVPVIVAQDLMPVSPICLCVADGSERLQDQVQRSAELTSR